MTTAPDGSPIDLYLRLPSLGEAEQVHELLPGGATVLELGCGVGRVTHELVRLGHPVTADVRAEGGVVAATVRYEADGETWRHPFVARLLDDEELDAELRGVGLRLTRVHGERDTWVEARLYSGA